MDLKENLLKFFTDNLSRDFLIKKLIPITFSVLFSSLFIGNLLFPTAYDWRYLVISALSDPGDNPNGYLIPSIGTSLSAFLMIPLIGYYHRRLVKVGKGNAITGTIFFTIGIIGLFSVGTIGQIIHGIPKLHEILASVGLLGILFSALFYGFLLLKDRFFGQKQFDFKLTIIIAIVLWTPVIGMATSQIYISVVENDWGWVGLEWIELGVPVVLSFALWEWLLLIAIVTYMILFSIAVPENVEKFIKRK
ncbi:MAG: hypothetical protein ACTSRA_05030 [Promethearchaeota archaeon]